MAYQSGPVHLFISNGHGGFNEQVQTHLNTQDLNRIFFSNCWIAKHQEFLVLYLMKHLDIQEFHLENFPFLLH